MTTQNSTCLQHICLPIFFLFFSDEEARPQKDKCQSWAAAWSSGQSPGNKDEKGNEKWVFQFHYNKKESGKCIKRKNNIIISSRLSFSWALCHSVCSLLYPTSSGCWITLGISVAMQRSESYKFDNILVLDYYLRDVVWSPPLGHCSRLEGGKEGGGQGRKWRMDEMVKKGGER